MNEEGSPMVISGIVIASRPENLSMVRHAVEGFDWAEVHFSDSTGRLVATIEGLDIDQSMERLKELKQLPRVLMAELAQYAMEEDDPPSQPVQRSHSPAALLEHGEFESFDPEKTRRHS